MATKTIKKIKKKKWYTLRAPKLFNEKEIGKTPAKEKTKLPGRPLVIDAFTLLGDIKKQHINLKLKVTGVKEDSVETEVIEYFISKSHFARVVRHRRTRVDIVVDGKTKDDRKVRVKLFILSNLKSTASKRTAMRKKATEIVSDMIGKMEFERIIFLALSSKIQKEIKEAVKNINPVVFVEVNKIELR